MGYFLTRAYDFNFLLLCSSSLLRPPVPCRFIDLDNHLTPFSNRCGYDMVDSRKAIVAPAPVVSAADPVMLGRGFLGEVMDNRVL